MTTNRLHLVQSDSASETESYRGSKLFMLLHKYKKLSGLDEIKGLGVFSTEQRARDFIDRVKGLPGFRDHPDGFKISEIPMNQDIYLSF